MIINPVYFQAQAAAAAAAAAAANNGQYSFVRTCDGKFVRTAIPMHEFAADHVVGNGTSVDSPTSVAGTGKCNNNPNQLECFGLKNNYCR